MHLPASNKAIQPHIKLQPRIRRIAEQLVEKALGGYGQFVSLHFRGKEFDQFDKANGGWKLAECIKKVEQCAKLAGPTKLYVATDIGKTFFGVSFPKGAKYLSAVFFEDLDPLLADIPERQDPQQWAKIVSFVEIAVAASARVFVGTKYSTFTDEISHLQSQGKRLKGHRPLYHQEFEADKGDFLDKSMCTALADARR
jgi:hypothetical protein